MQEHVGSIYGAGLQTSVASEPQVHWVFFSLFLFFFLAANKIVSMEVNRPGALHYTTVKFLSFYVVFFSMLRLLGCNHSL